MTGTGKGRRDWWSRSAAEDGDDRPDDDWLDDFDFEQVEDRAAGGGIAGLWSRYGGGVGKPPSDTFYDPAAGRWVDPEAVKAARLTTAQRLVQGLVDTFATGDTRYTVVFAENATPASTDYGARKIVVDPRPLLDPALDEATANDVVTAMAVHESSHVRYGLDTHKAAEAAFRGTRDAKAAMDLSGILDDVRIDRRFAADFPGFADVYAPAVDYVADQIVGPGRQDDPTGLSKRDIGVDALRYDHRVAWTPETQPVREWWQAWGERWTATDSPEDHVAGVREALEYIKDDTQPDADEGLAAGGSCLGDAIEDAADAAEGGATDQAREQAAERAQELLDKGKALVGGGPDGSDYSAAGEVYWSPGGLLTGSTYGKKVPPVAAAVAAIRAAFARSRGGHYNTQAGLKTGRLDSRSLSRIASADYRLFSRRTAPSERRFRVWLMIDCSSSMSPQIGNAAAVAEAIAAAASNLPNVSVDVWGWTSGARRMGAWGAVRVYAAGGPVTDVRKLTQLSMGGTPDYQVLQWAGRAIRKQLARDETGIILMAADGSGSLEGSGPQGQQLVEDIRRKGVQVVAVALARGLAGQEYTFGRGNVIKWNGSIEATARPIAALIARAIRQG